MASVDPDRLYGPLSSGLKRFRSHRRAVLSVALVGVFALTGWLLFRPVEYVPGEVKEWARQAQRTAAPWPVAPIDAEAGRDEARRFLRSRLPEIDGNTAERAVIDLGVNHAVDFLMTQATATLPEYIDWASAQGLSIRNEWPQEPRFKEEVFQASYRRSLHIRDDGIHCTPSEFFRDIYQHNNDAGGGAYRPAGICTGNEAAYISITTFTHASDTFEYEDDILSKPPGVEFWVGGPSWSWLRFTDPPNTLNDIIVKHGEATVMRMLLLTVGPTGLKMPTDLYQFYDPDRKQWVVYRVLQANFGPVVGTGPSEDTWGVY